MFLHKELHQFRGRQQASVQRSEGRDDSGGQRRRVGDDHIGGVHQLVESSDNGIHKRNLHVCSVPNHVVAALTGNYPNIFNDSVLVIHGKSKHGTPSPVPAHGAQELITGDCNQESS